MKRTAYKTLIPALILGLSGTAMAQTAAPQKAAPTPQANNIEQGIDAMFKSLDKDKNNQLSFEEFKQGVVAERRQAMILQRLNGIFRAADANKNGALESAEFNTLPAVKQATGVKPRFSDYDANKDQKLSFREYLDFVGKMSSAPAPKK